MKVNPVTILLGIAPAVGPLIGGAVGKFASYSGAFGFLAVTAFIMLLVVIWVLPETRPVSVQSNRLDLGSFVRIFKNRTGSAVLFTGFILYDVLYTLIVFLPVVLKAGYHLSATQIGLASMLLMVFSLNGSKISGRLQAKIGSAKSLILTFSFVIITLVLFIIAAQMSLVILLITFSALLPIESTIWYGIWAWQHRQCWEVCFILTGEWHCLLDVQRFWWGWLSFFLVFNWGL